MDKLTFADIGVDIERHDDGIWVKLGRLNKIREYVDLGITQNQLKFNDSCNLIINGIFDKCEVKKSKFIGLEKYIYPLLAAIVLQRIFKNDKYISFDGIDLAEEFDKMFGDKSRILYALYDLILQSYEIGEAFAIFNTMQYSYIASLNEFLYDADICKEFVTLFGRKAYAKNGKYGLNLKEYQSANLCAVIADRHKKQIDWGNIWQLK